jgi:uncharacterized protein YciI
MLAISVALLLIGAAPAEPWPQAAAQAPAAASSLYIVIYRPGKNWVAGKSNSGQKLRPHVVFIQRMLDEGRLVAGGPWGDNMGGMAIFRASSLEEAQAFVAADPAVSEGVFEAELKAWTPLFDSKRPLAG